MVGFDVKVCDQLAIDGFDDLTDRIVEAAYRLGDLSLLVAAGFGEQADATVLSEFGRDFGTDVGFVADDDAVAVFYQEFATDSQDADAGCGPGPGRRSCDASS